MALLYDATLSPTKPELVAAWLPVAPYGLAPTAPIEMVGAFRFDDPAGEVGIETHLVRVDGATIQVPLTYRSAPLVGATVVAEMEHSVLGRRYVHDATTDPVYVQQVIAAIADAGHEAEQYVHVGDAAPQRIPSSVHVSGSGAPGVALPDTTHLHVALDGTDTVVEATGVTVVVHHRPLDSADGPALLGEWSGGGGVLASLR
ncbi:maltokinase N-terminal cap-like domain-containing protein [Prescottella subtropica]|uniref:maltokinase N-terminal cap-like domain-containing protein n=1 Tax=Prescottella subtropica TaxID=2545757 RepID=UPI0010F9D307|nr:hypothetical protein [Prescottella subtropica]